MQKAATKSEAMEAQKRPMASLYYSDGYLNVSIDQLKAENAPFQTVSYNESELMPPRALPYKSDLAQSAFKAYGPAFRMAMIHLEMVRMALINNERTKDASAGPTKEATMQLISSAYPPHMRDIVSTCISAIQAKPVSEATFMDGVLQLAMTIAMVAEGNIDAKSDSKTDSKTTSSSSNTSVKTSP